MCNNSYLNQHLDDPHWHGPPSPSNPKFQKSPTLLSGVSTPFLPGSKILTPPFHYAPNPLVSPLIADHILEA